MSRTWHRRALDFVLFFAVLLFAAIIPQVGTTQASFDCSAVTGIPQVECQALVALYRATDGDNWADNTGWLETDTPCSWYGVSCSDGNTHVLSLENNQLNGVLPPEIGDLTNLFGLELESNQLSGAIPSEIGNLRELGGGGLLLSDNRLSGPIPPEIGNLRNLWWLDLDGNLLTGPMPPEVEGLEVLIRLDLSGNQFTSLPSELGNLGMLRYLYLHDNPLAGEVPPFLAGLSKLQHFYFYGTDWCVPSTGPVADWISSIPDVQGTGLVCLSSDIDIGFRPDPDGYSFPNWAGMYPTAPSYLDPDFRQEDLVWMFGEEAVCVQGAGSECTLRPAAHRWLRNVNEAMNRGHCDGIAVTSLRLFRGLESAAALQIGADSTHDLVRESVRHYVARYFAMQMTDPVAAYKDAVRHNAPSVILHQLGERMLSGAPDPTTLFVRQAGDGGHAIVPYAVEDRGSGIYWLKVYDNNHPDDPDRHVIIDTEAETWSYDLGGTTFSGDDQTHTLGIVPISEYAKQPECPWCGNAQTSQTTSVGLGYVWLTGGGHLLLKDSQGRRMGYAGDNFVKEIAGASEIIIDGGLGVALEPVYTVPLSDTYTIVLDGQALTRTETAAVAQFGPGYAAGFEDISVTPTTNDRMVIAADGAQLTYAPNEARETTLSFATDEPSASWKLQILGADIGPGEVVTLTKDVDSGDLILNNAKAGGSQYDIEIDRYNPAGGDRFVHRDVVVSATDTHYIGYGLWDGSGAIGLEIDQGSDGTVDQILELDNEMSEAYLPLIMSIAPPVPVSPVLTPFDANVDDLVGPSSWATNYGKTPEIIVASSGAELDVLAQDYDPSTPWNSVLLHITRRFSGEGYKVTQALTDLPMLDRVMGLAVDDDGNRYYATGVDESTLISPEYPPLDTYRSDIVRLIKVSRTGQVLYNIDLDVARHKFNPDAEMIINPMTASTGRLAVGGDEVALVHGINTDPDWSIEGRRHQKALSTRLDAATGAVLRTSSIWVSHSFDQRLLYDGEGIVEHHLGDAYPRTIVFGRADPTYGKDVAYPLFHIKGELGDNRTWTRLGNMALIEGDPAYRYLALFVTETNATTTDSINGPRNLAIVRVEEDNSLDPSLPDTLTVVSKDVEWTNRLRWLTHYTGDSDLHAERPKLIGVGGNQYIVLWEKWRDDDTWSGTFKGVYGMVIDAMGNTVVPGQLITTDHHLHRGDDAFVLDGGAAWLTGNAAERQLLIHHVDASLKYEMTVLE